LQPSDPPHEFGGRSAHVCGVQHEPMLQVSPLSQSPQWSGDPSHSVTSPQNTPAHVGDTHGPHVPEKQLSEPAHTPHTTVSPHSLTTGPHSEPATPQPAGSGGTTQEPCWHWAAPVQPPQSSTPPQPSDFDPQSFMAHVAVVHATQF